MKLTEVFVSVLCCCVVATFAQDTTPKEGHCGLIVPELVGTCSRDCEYDSECSADLKCCRNACGGSHCATPETEDPCIGHKCENEIATCVNEGTHSVCKCPEFCAEVYEPVCGQTEGAPDIDEFTNKCKLSVRACKINKKILEVACTLKEEVAKKSEEFIDTDGAGAGQIRAGILAVLMSSFMMILFR